MGGEEDGGLGLWRWGEKDRGLGLVRGVGVGVGGVKQMEDWGGGVK